MMTAKGVTMKRKLIAVAATLLGTSGASIAYGESTTSGHGFPTNSPIEQGLPNASPGDCFARVIIPASYDTIPRTVTTQEAFETLDIIPAQLAPDTLNIKTRDEGLRYIVRQPRYETVTEEVLIRPAYEELQVIPAQFETVTETITVGEPKLVWRPGRHLSDITRVDPATGTVYCLVEEPAETRTVSRRVVRVPEQVQTVTIPAQYKTVTKQVLVDPGGVDQEPIPAEYTDVAVSRLVSPASQSRQLQPAQTSTIDTRRLRTPERFEWVPVLCDTNATPQALRSIQTALTERGYYTGAINGQAGPATQSALTGFQRANGIAHEGFLSARTLSLLGLGHLAPAVQPSATSAQRVAPVPQIRRQTQASPTGTGYFNDPVADLNPAPQSRTAALPEQNLTQPSPVRPARSGRRLLNWTGKK